MAHKVSLSWDAAPSGQTITSWTIRRQDTAGGAFAVIGTSPTNSFVDSNPQFVEGQGYNYEVAADNASGESPESTVITVTIPFSVPTAPTGLKASVA